MAQVASEHDEQCTVIEWCSWNSNRLSGLERIFAIPNGGYRNGREAARLKNEGVKPGVPDLFLPVPRGKYHGLWIEMKRSDRKNQATVNQKEWLGYLKEAGYQTAVCFNADEAIESIEDYYETNYSND